MNNSVSYASPSLNGFKLRALYGAGENSSQPGGSRIGSIHSASVQYDRGRFSSNLAYETRKTTEVNTDRFYAAGASRQFELARVGVLAQARRDDVDSAANNAFSVSVQVPLGAGAVLADARQFRSRSVAEGGARSLSVRYDYNLSKRTMLYAGAARIRNETNARFRVNGNTGAALAVAPGEDPRSVIAGVRHSF